ncbi:MAG: FAD-binding oxidoreductase [Synechococcales bacterium]|nr:FAD-binding oxidoreductase [Synechococcales bacterium]
MSVLINSHDIIIVGAGITGTALGYELAHHGLRVLLLEQHATLQGATRHSYGGIPYWAGDRELTQTLCAEGIAIHRQLAAELEAETEFRELKLLLTLTPEQNLEAIVASYAPFAIQPQCVDPQQAQELEPLLNSQAIAAALVLPHAHWNPVRGCQAYQQAMQRLGGQLAIETVTHIERSGSGWQVQTSHQTRVAAAVVVCAGAMTRSLLQQSGIRVKQYFSYAESIETPRVDLELRTLVMPAITQRFDLEATASREEWDPLWEQPDGFASESIGMPAVLDAGAIQFGDRSLRIGQISRILPQPDRPWGMEPAQVDSRQQQTSEQLMRDGIRPILPAIADLPGQWQACQVAFSRDHLPLVGALPDQPGLSIFSGFSNPMTLVPAIARRFAQEMVGSADPLLRSLRPDRFA